VSYIPHKWLPIAALASLVRKRARSHRIIVEVERRHLESNTGISLNNVMFMGIFLT
jgi:hypothetical protein